MVRDRYRDPAKSSPDLRLNIRAACTACRCVLVSPTPSRASTPPRTSRYIWRVFAAAWKVWEGVLPSGDTGLANMASIRCLSVFRTDVAATVRCSAGLDRTAHSTSSLLTPSLIGARDITTSIGVPCESIPRTAIWRWALRASLCALLASIARRRAAASSSRFLASIMDWA